MDLNTGVGLLNTGGSNSTTDPVTTIEVQLSTANAQAGEEVTITAIVENTSSVTFTTNDATLEGTGLQRTFIAPSLTTPSEIEITVRALNFDGNGFITENATVNVAAAENGELVAEITASSSTVRAGQPFSLTATEADSYLWSTGERTKTIELVAPSNTEASNQTYSVLITDASGREATASITINFEALPDTQAPIISVSGNPTTTINVGQAIPTFSASTDDGSSVTITGAVDNASPGTYIFRFNSTDSSNNAAEEVIRTVIVQAISDTQSLLSLSRAQFKYIGADQILVYPGRANVETFAFRILNGESDIVITPDGFFDFENNNIRNVELICKGKKIDSFSSLITFNHGQLYADMSSFNLLGQQSCMFVIYVGEDQRGIVLSGAGKPSAPSLVFKH